MSSKWLILVLLGGGLMIAACEEKPAAPTGGGGGGTTVTSAADDQQALTLIDQINAAIKDKKISDAEAALKKLEGMKDKVSADVRKKIDAIKKVLAAAKATVGDVKMPQIPK